MFENEPMERSTFTVRPPRPVRYKGQSYMFESFDVGHIEFARPDGKRTIDFDEEDVYCTLADSFSRKVVRVHLQDRDLEFL